MSTFARTYPRCEPWDYIATSREAHELDRLRKLRADIAQSKKEFEHGREVLLKTEFFDCFSTQQTTKKIIKGVANVFISSPVRQELINHFNSLLRESPDEQDAPWLIEQLKDFFLNKLSLSPTYGLRKDEIHQGIRVQPYGFYEVYYYFNGQNIYIAHIEYNKTSSL